MTKLRGGQNKRRIGYPNRRLGEVSLKTEARYWEVPYHKLYYRVAFKGMDFDEALKDLGVNVDDSPISTHTKVCPDP